MANNRPNNRPNNNSNFVANNAAPGALVAAPSNLVATQVSATQIDLTWDDNSWNENGFKLERGTDGITFGTEITIAADAESDSNTQLSNGTKYYYRIRAYVNDPE